MSVILNLPFAYSVWISAAVAIVYTLFGGLYAVAYTDVLQLLLTFVCLVSYKKIQAFIALMRFDLSGHPCFILFCFVLSCLFFAVVMHTFCSKQLCSSRHYKDCLELHIPRTLDRHVGPGQHVEVD